jgi:GlpG protein
MRSLGTIPEAAAAQRFADYLLTRGIVASVERGTGGFAVWVRDEDRLEEAGREFDRFLKEPGDPRYASAAAAAGDLRRREEEEVRRHERNRIDVRGGWAKRARGSRPVTALLAVLSIAVAAATSLGERDTAVREALVFGVLPDEEELTRRIEERASRGDPEELRDLSGLRGWDAFRRLTGYTGFEQIAAGEVWRLFTPILLHFSLLHLVFNLLWLYDLGGQIEQVKGRLALLLLVLGSAALSNAAQNLTNGPNFGGMSGVNYALFGFIWMRQRFRPLEGLGLGPNTVPLMLGWLVVCMAGWVGSVANTAHFVGLAVGVASGLAPHLYDRARR